MAYVPPLYDTVGADLIGGYAPPEYNAISGDLAVEQFLPDEPAESPISAPNFPARDGGYLYLAGYGLTYEELGQCCIKKAIVTGLYDRQNVNVIVDGVEHMRIPVYIHTDAGARESLVNNTPQPDPIAYFKDAALMFPFSGTDDTNYTYVAALVHTDPDSSARTVKAIIGFFQGFYGGERGVANKAIVNPTDLGTYTKRFGDIKTYAAPTYRVLAHIRLCSRQPSNEIPTWVLEWEAANETGVLRARSTEEDVYRWYLDYVLKDEYVSLYDLTDDGLESFAYPFTGDTFERVSPELLTAYSVDAESDYQKIKAYVENVGVRIGRGGCYNGFSFTPQDLEEAVDVSKPGTTYDSPEYLESRGTVFSGLYSFLSRDSQDIYVTSDVKIVRDALNTVTLPYGGIDNQLAGSIYDGPFYVGSVSGCKDLDVTSYAVYTQSGTNYYMAKQGTLEFGRAVDFFWDSDVMSERTDSGQRYVADIDTGGCGDSSYFSYDGQLNSLLDYETISWSDVKFVDFTKNLLYDYYTGGLFITGYIVSEDRERYTRGAVASFPSDPCWSFVESFPYELNYSYVPPLIKQVMSTYVDKIAFEPVFEFSVADSVQRQTNPISVSITKPLQMVSQAILDLHRDMMPEDMSSYTIFTFPESWIPDYRVRIDLYIVPYDVRLSTIPL